MTIEESKEIFSKNLRDMIARSGKDQKTIASDLGVNPPTFNQWVTGTALPPVYKIQALAEYLGCTTAYLIGESGSDILVKLSEKEYLILSQYRDADKGTRAMVRRLLAYAERDYWRGDEEDEDCDNERKGSKKPSAT